MAEQACSGPAAEGGAASSRRGSRRGSRVNYALLEAGGIEQNDDPNAAAEAAPGPRSKQPAHRALQAGEAQPAPSKGKRKAAAAAAAAAAEAAEAAPSGGDADWAPGVEAGEAAGEPPIAEDGAEPRQRKKRARVLVDVHGGAGPAGPADPGEAENEFERAVSWWVLGWLVGAGWCASRQCGGCPALGLVCRT